MTPVLLDTDIGSDVDDALALGVLLASAAQLDLVALTTVSADAAGRARAAARLLGLAGRTEVGVHVGVRDALVRRDRFVWREIETSGYPDGPDAPILDEPAPERIVRAADEVDGLEIVAVGPLTNLAHALALDPQLPKKVKRLHVMGGHVREVRVGELVCRPGIDYNLCSDPEASVMVLGAGFATRLVTADVTLQTWMTEDDRLRLAGAGVVPGLLAELVGIWTPIMHELFTAIGGTLAPDNAAFLHDPLTLLALVDPAPLGFETLRIVPTIERGVLRTREAPPDSDLGAPMEVATSVDALAARRGIVDRLVSL